MNLKTLLFIFSLISVHFLMSQTKMIALKSHSGDVSSTEKYVDDEFGNPRIEFNLRIDSIIRISDSTVVQVSNMGRDTICHNPYLNDTTVSIQTLKYMYSPDIKFIGFEKNEKEEEEVKTKQKTIINRNEIHWFIGLVLIFGCTFTYFQTQYYRSCRK